MKIVKIQIYKNGQTRVKNPEQYTEYEVKQAIDGLVNEMHRRVNANIGRRPEKVHTPLRSVEPLL